MAIIYSGVYRIVVHNGSFLPTGRNAYGTIIYWSWHVLLLITDGIFLDVAQKNKNMVHAVVYSTVP
jgi:hypothetical protein